MTQEDLKVLKQNGWTIGNDRFMGNNRIILTKKDIKISIDKDYPKENAYRVALSNEDGYNLKNGFSYVLECFNVKRENIMRAIRFLLEEKVNIENVRKEKYQND